MLEIITWDRRCLYDGGETIIKVSFRDILSLLRASFDFTLNGFFARVLDSSVRPKISFNPLSKQNLITIKV